MGQELMDPSVYIGPAILALFLPLMIGFLLRLERRATERLDQKALECGLRTSVHHTVWNGLKPDYFDTDLFLSKPQNIGAVVDWFQDVSEQERAQGVAIDRLAFIEKTEGPVGALTLRDLLSWRTGISSVILRPRRRGPAYKFKFLRQGPQGEEPPADSKASFCSRGQPEQILLVSDVITTGTTIKNAISMIEKGGGSVVGVAVLYDREERDRAALGDIRLLAMTTAGRLEEARKKGESVKAVAS